MQNYHRQRRQRRNHSVRGTAASHQDAFPDSSQRCELQAAAQLRTIDAHGIDVTLYSQSRPGTGKRNNFYIYQCKEAW